MRPSIKVSRRAHHNRQPHMFFYFTGPRCIENTIFKN
jgi:hypothetical protein